MCPVTCDRSNTACSMISRCPQRWALPSTPTFDGKVVAATDDAIVVKLKPSEFAVLDPSLVTGFLPPRRQGACQPYARRRFDGLRADTPEVITEKTSDGTPLHHHEAHPRLGAGPSCPFPRRSAWSWASSSSSWKRCRPRSLPAHHPHAGGCRCPRLHLGRSHALQDHRDPAGDQLHGLDRKFEGRVTILYDRGGDTYVVELHRRTGESVGRSARRCISTCSAKCWSGSSTTGAGAQIDEHP